MNPYRILYIKGGHATEEAERLFRREGDIEERGPDQFLLSVLANLRGNKFRLASIGKKTERKKILAHEAINYGIRSPARSKFIKVTTYLFWSLRFVLETIRWRPTHILCGIDGLFSLIALYTARLTHAKYVFFVHNALDLSTINSVSKFANKVATRKADAIIVHGPFLHDQVRNLGTEENRIFEYDTGFAPEKYIFLNEPDKKWQSSNGSPCISFVYAGRIEENKGVGDLLEAFLMLRENHQASLSFIGEGQFLNKLQDKASRSRYSDDIKIFGQVSNQEVLELMHQATVAITPTQSKFPEGRCMSAMEALLVGTPVIAPNFGPFPYLINNLDNGILYKPDDVFSLTNAMRQLIEDKDLLKKLRCGAITTANELKKPNRSFFDTVEVVIFKN